LTVATVCERFNLKPTGRSPDQLSGCAIVAEALGEASMGKSAKAIEVIWYRYRGAMPTVPGAAARWFEPVLNNPPLE
jgi:hypothetical protein